MNNSYSILLDLLRFLAAMLVLVYHAEPMLGASYLNPIAGFGHDAVIFFFILSGYVIGFVSTEKETKLKDYAISRAARMYSVALPSLILVVVLIIFGSHISPEIYAKYESTDWLKVISSSLLFLNQTAVLRVDVPTNTPYWSINYEVWYYIFFGILFYTKGYLKWILAILAFIIAGVKILLLFPIWLAGYFLFINHKHISTKSLAGLPLIIVSFCLYGYIRYHNIDDLIFEHSSLILFDSLEQANDSLVFSKRFVADYIIALIFIALMCGFLMLSEYMEGILIKFKKVIRSFSSYTFSIYLFHYPIFILLSSIYENSILIILLTILLIVIIAHVSEKRKGAYVTLFKKLTGKAK